MSTPPGQTPASRSRVARNAFHLLLGQGSTTALAILLSAVLGRWLGVADFGLFFLLTSMSTFAFVVADWGQQQYVVREVARRPEAAHGLLATSTTLRIATATAGAGFLSLSAWLLGYEPRTCLLAALMMATMLPFFLAQGFGQVFRGLERMELDASVSVVNKVLILVFTVTALRLGQGLLGAMLAQALAGLGALAMAWRLMSRTGLHFGRPTRSFAVALMAGGTALMMMAISMAAHSYVDAVVLSRMGSAEEMGWFGAARNIFGTLIAPAGILATASFPALSRVAHDTPRLRAALQASLRPLLGLAALGGVGTYLYAGFAVQLIYGQGHFGNATGILAVYAPGIFLLFLDILLGATVIAVGRSQALAVGKVINVIVATLLAIALVPVFQRSHGNGGMGIAAAFGLSELIMFVTAATLLPRGTLGVSMLGDAGRALAAGAATLLVFRLLPPFSPVLGIPACVLVFVGFAAGVGLIRAEELALLRDFARRDRTAQRPV